MVNITEFDAAWAELGSDLKTRDVDAFNKRLIREKVDVAFLEPHVRKNDGKYFRTYFQVSLHGQKSIEEKLTFIEAHFDLLNDWWHTDILPPFLGNQLPFELALEKARVYTVHPLPYVRRLGYVLFIPRLVRNPAKIEPLFALLHNDDVYHVVMAEAWLISFLGMCAPDRTLAYLKTCELTYDIVGKAIQKICDSHVVSAEDKERFKNLREERKASQKTRRPK